MAEGTSADLVMEGITERELQALKDYLDIINGQDAYSTESVCLGTVTTDEYLVLPLGIEVKEVGAHEVGKGGNPTGLKVLDYARIYALNKAAAPAGIDAVKFALARVEAIQLGWLDSYKEVRFAKPLPNSVQIYADDVLANKDLVKTARSVAFLIPLIAEVIFRTTGHHYLTGMAGEYEDKYARLLHACMAPELASFLPAGILYHTLFHWISPGRSRHVAEASTSLSPGLIPEAVSVRLNAAPAGTAIITTTAAVLDSMVAGGLLDAMIRASKLDLPKVMAMRDDIISDPCAYHKTAHAYGRAPFQPDREYVVALKIAQAFAPVAQGYVNAMYEGAAMSRAKALAKHAEANPLQLRKSFRYFRGAARRDVEHLADIFASHAEEDDATMDLPALTVGRDNGGAPP